MVLQSTGVWKYPKNLLIIDNVLSLVLPSRQTKQKISMDKNNKKYFYPLIFCIYVLMFCLLIAFPHPLPGRFSTKLRTEVSQVANILLISNKISMFDDVV